MRAIVGSTIGGFVGQLIVALAGACLLVWLYRAVSSRG
jgi:uncharacterized membrane protein YeaQ/YmgE (transglycosylase-associated protein family)